LCRVGQRVVSRFLGVVAGGQLWGVFRQFLGVKLRNREGTEQDFGSGWQ
jgi:hypothetical protein